MICWWIGCWEKGRILQWPLGLWPKCLGRCGTTGPDEEDQKRKQHQLDAFIYDLIYLPQQPSLVAILTPFYRKRNWGSQRLNYLSRLTQVWEEAEWEDFIQEADRDSVGDCSLRSNSQGLNLPLSACNPGQVSSFVFICKAGLRVIPSS